MPYQETPPDIWEMLIAFVVGTVSATVSITRRIISGHPSTYLWVFSEYMTAILCGYLMYGAYPFLAPIMPEALTMPIMVAVVAHSGGRIFQESEEFLVKFIERYLNRPGK